MKPTKIYNTFEIVVVPFPFIDSPNVKKRPAIILSSLDFNRESSACVMAMITSALHFSWPGDIMINDLKSAGLPVESIIRMKLFTLDQRLILKKLGTLSRKDQNDLVLAIKQLFPL